MPRSRPTANPVSYHKHTKQYYVTRAGKRVYLGSDKDEALKKYHRLGLGLELPEEPPRVPVKISVKDLANRFIATQQANWRDVKGTLRCYRDWLGRFIKDHPRLKAADFTFEMFAAWKVSLKEHGYSPESINHFLVAVRSMFRFAEDADLIGKSPKLRRVKNEPTARLGSEEKPLYSAEQINALLEAADVQIRTMILLALNCGFGPKDLHDLTWDDVDGDRVTLPRSKTGVCQTYLLWPETKALLTQIFEERSARFARLLKRGRRRTDDGHVFVTRFWKPWSKDAISEQFRKLCTKARVECYGIYRMRHCASTAVSLVASPHVQRKFLRHSQLQQQVTYTHIPDFEVDKAVMKARERLLGTTRPISGRESGPGQEGVA
jgi:integrase